jgi:hypothetical protein
MGFKDPDERSELLGPLFASEVKASTPVFGPERFTLKSTRAKLDIAVRKQLQSQHDPVFNLLAPHEASTGPELSASKASTLSNNLEELRLEHKSSKTVSKKEDSATSSKVLSSIELQDKAHYTSVNLGPPAQPKSDILDQIMLQRATRGYLFDSAHNQTVVADDPWLQDVWRWIKGNSLILQVQ